MADSKTAATEGTAIIAARPGRASPAHSGKLKNKGTPAELRKKSQAFAKNITKRGQVSEKKTKEEEGLKLSPWLIGAFAFLLVGSAIVQIVQTASSKPVTGA